ncbi:MAG: hypothetical protein M3458_14680 [Acidobacteriota bacterium]|nr:hypothetical protein [Acidobacteriota bacterium]
MRVIETDAIVSTDGTLSVKVSSDIRPGSHRVVVVIGEQNAAEKRPEPLKFSAYPAGLISDTLCFRREDIYGVD